jgi:hypothetical protein
VPGFYDPNHLAGMHSNCISIVSKSGVKESEEAGAQEADDRLDDDWNGSVRRMLWLFGKWTRLSYGIW